jgi:hypothetical protein
MLLKSRLLLLTLLFIPGFWGMGQSRDSIKKMLVGSWARIDDAKATSGSSIEKTTSRILTFYKKGKFQEEITNDRYNRWRFFSPFTKWKIKSNHISVFKHMSFQDDFYDPEEAMIKSADIIRLTSDTLWLKITSSFSGTKITDSSWAFKRIPIRTLRHSNEARPNDLVLSEISRPNNTLIVGSYLYPVSIQLKNDTLNNYVHQVTGNLERVTYDTIVIELTTESLLYTDAKGNEHFSQKIERVNNHIDNGQYRFYLTKNIISLVSHEDKHPKMAFAGGAVVALATVCTFLASPIFASAPHFNSFDTHQFLLFSGISILSGLVVGVPLLAIGHGPSTEYYLDPEAAKKNDAPCWRIKPFVYE